MITYRIILEANLIINSHKKLCGLFGWKYTKGTNSRKAQLKELSTYCKWHKEGNKYIIDEIYDEPLEKIDGRKNNKCGNNNVYTEYIDKLILDIIVTHNSINASFEDLFTDYDYIPIIDKEQYRFISYQYLKFSEIHNISKGLAMEYGKEVYAKLNSVLTSSLGRLQKYGLITWQYDYMITYFNYKSEIEERLVDEDERQAIIDAEKEAYIALNIYPVQRKNKDTNKKFKDWVTTKMEEWDYVDGFYYYRKVFTIKTTDKLIESGYEKLSTDDEEDIRFELIDLFKKAIREKIGKILYKRKLTEEQKELRKKRSKEELEEDDPFYGVCKSELTVEYAYDLDIHDDGIKILNEYMWVN